MYIYYVKCILEKLIEFKKTSTHSFFNLASDPLLLINGLTMPTNNYLTIFSKTGLFGVLFADNKEPAFAGLKMCQAFGSTILFASSEYLCTIVKLIILLIFAVLALLGLQVLEFKLRKERRSARILNVGPTSV
jgi:hypothetical protein